MQNPKLLLDEKGLPIPLQRLLEQKITEVTNKIKNGETGLEILKKRALLFFSLRRYKEALRDCDTILEKSTTDIDILILKIQSLLKQKNYQQAGEELGAITKEGDTYFKPSEKNRALLIPELVIKILLGQERYNEAEKLCDEKIKRCLSLLKPRSKSKKISTDSEYNIKVELHGAYFLKGKCLFEQGNYQEALEIFEKSYSEISGDNNYPLVYWLGRTLFALGKFQEAAEYFQKAAEFNNSTNYRDGWVCDQIAIPFLGNGMKFVYWTGLALFYQKDYEAAVKQLRLAVVLYDNQNSPYYQNSFYLAKSLNLLGKIYWRQKKYQKAEKYFKAWREVDDQDYRPTYWLGRISFEQKNLKEAEKYFEESTTLSNQNYEQFYWLGRTFFAQKKFKEAQKPFERSIQLNEGEENKSFIYLGNLLINHYEFKKALECFQKILTNHPCAWPLYYFRSRLLCKNNNYEGALSDINTVIKNIKPLKNSNNKESPNPKYVYVSALYCLQGDILCYQGKYKESIISYTRCPNIYDIFGMSNKQKSHVAYNLSFAYHSIGKTKEALDSLSMAIECNKENDNALYARSWIFIDQKKWEKARKDLNQILLRKPQEQEALVLRGIIYIQQGNHENAKEDLLQSIKKPPKKKIALYIALYQAYCGLAYISIIEKDEESAAKYIEQASESRKKIKDVELKSGFLKDHNLDKTLPFLQALLFVYGKQYEKAMEPFSLLEDFNSYEIPKTLQNGNTNRDKDERNLLMYAALYGNLPLINILVAQTPVTLSDKKGKTAFHFAVRDNSRSDTDQQAILLSLIENKPIIPSILHLLEKDTSVEIIQILIKHLSHLIDVDQITSKVIEMCLNKNQPDLAKQLLEKWIGLNLTRISSWGFLDKTPKLSKEVFIFLVKQMVGEEINRQDNARNTLLHRVLDQKLVTDQGISYASILLEDLGADPRIPNSRQWTANHVMVKNNDLSLLEKCTNQLNQSELYALAHFGIKEGTSDETVGFLLQEIQLFRDKGEDIKIHPSLLEAWFLGKSAGNREIFQLLLQHREFFNKSDKNKSNRLNRLKRLKKLKKSFHTLSSFKAFPFFSILLECKSLSSQDRGYYFFYFASFSEKLEAKTLSQFIETGIDYDHLGTILKNHPGINWSEGELKRNLIPLLVQHYPEKETLQLIRMILKKSDYFDGQYALSCVRETYGCNDLYNLLSKKWGKEEEKIIDPSLLPKNWSQFDTFKDSDNDKKLSQGKKRKRKKPSKKKPSKKNTDFFKTKPCDLSNPENILQLLRNIQKSSKKQKDHQKAIFHGGLLSLFSLLSENEKNNKLYKSARNALMHQFKSFSADNISEIPLKNIKETASTLLTLSDNRSNLRENKSTTLQPQFDQIAHGIKLLLKFRSISNQQERTIASISAFSLIGEALQQLNHQGIALSTMETNSILYVFLQSAINIRESVGHYYSDSLNKVELFIDTLLERGKNVVQEIQTSWNTWRENLEKPDLATNNELNFRKPKKP